MRSHIRASFSVTTISCAPWTAASVSSIFTALYPSQHKQTFFGLKADDANVLGPYTTMPELFKTAGFETSAFITNVVAGAYLTRKGFDQHTVIGARQPQSSPDAIFSKVLDLLKTDPAKKQFVYVHLWEPHSPYEPNTEFDRYKGTLYDNSLTAGVGLFSPTEFILPKQANLGDTSAIERIRGLYDGQIAQVDEAVGTFFRQLQTFLADDDLLLAVMSDHGEMIYLRNQYYMTSDHCSVFEPALHVPLILYGAGIPRGVEVKVASSHIDTAATVLDLAGTGVNAFNNGHSMAALLDGKIHEEPILFAEQDIYERLRMVSYDGHKLVRSVDSGEEMLFDLNKDPDEKTDIKADHPREYESLKSLMDNVTKDFETDQAWLQRAATLPLTEQITDDETQGFMFNLRGTPWKVIACPECTNGSAYMAIAETGNQNPKQVEWRLFNPIAGNVRVSYHLPPVVSGLDGTFAGADFVVYTRHGEDPLTLAGPSPSGEWVDLGVHTDVYKVVLRTNDHSAGIVFADSMRFTPVQ
jgi:arylsulfatase A-like enzyme